MTITRVGTNQKYSSGWDIAFGGKKAAKAAAGVKLTPAKAAKKKAAPKKKAAAPKKKAKK